MDFLFRFPLIEPSPTDWTPGRLNVYSFDLNASSHARRRQEVEV
jgi:hypothetical protein